ncbi:filamin-A-like [Gigantopelta aegis]|uniref:filamin-A-like n=1 Tax=Gigantopelta aegis TaxID=1735272 RepID=UPI001B88C0CE|nr:filamin-A-like [Gigantopelta aegis]
MSHFEIFLNSLSTPGKLRPRLISPDGSSVPVDLVTEGSDEVRVQYIPREVGRSPVVTEGSDEVRVQYIPREVGDHTVCVKCGAVEAGGSPFTAKAYDARAIIVSALHDGYVNRPIRFTIDVRKAGEGQLQIMVNSGNLPNEVELPETGVYEISFIPVEPGRHKVEISFNDENLPYSPMTCNVINPLAEVVELRTLQQVEQETEFLIKIRVAYKMDLAVDCIIMCKS